MATFLDVTALQAFSKVFVFLLVVIAVYAVAAKSKAFGDATWIAWIVGIILGVFILMSNLLIGVIQTIAPWFAVVFIFVIFITMSSKVFGATSVDLDQYKWVLFVVVVIIFIVGSLSYIRQNTSVPGDLDEDGDEIKDESYLTTQNFIFHPKIMGVIFILLVAIFTVALLAGKST
jgi:predicted membrane channel-forming protein YqfA (hemolysin III family)